MLFAQTFHLPCEHVSFARAFRLPCRGSDNHPESVRLQLGRSWGRYKLGVRNLHSRRVRRRGCERSATCADFTLGSTYPNGLALRCHFLVCHFTRRGGHAIESCDPTLSTASVCWAVNNRNGPRERRSRETGQAPTRPDRFSLNTSMAMDLKIGVLNGFETAGETV